MYQPLFSIAKRTLLDTFAHSKTTRLGSIGCSVNDDRLIVFTTINVLLCVIGVPLVLRQVPRPENNEGELEYFNLTHGNCCGICRGVYATLATCRGRCRRSCHGTVRGTCHCTCCDTYATTAGSFAGTLAATVCRGCCRGREGFLSSAVPRDFHGTRRRCCRVRSIPLTLPRSLSRQVPRRHPRAQRWHDLRKLVSGISCRDISRHVAAIAATPVAGTATKNTKQKMCIADLQQLRETGPLRPQRVSREGNRDEHPLRSRCSHAVASVCDKYEINASPLPELETWMFVLGGSAVCGLQCKNHE